MNRYTSRRHSGPGKRGYSQAIAYRVTKHDVLIHVCHKLGSLTRRAFYLHPTKGWRSAGAGQ